MNAEDRKHLEILKTPPLSVADKWLIAHLEAETQEVERYQRENYDERIVELLKRREQILERNEAAERRAKGMERAGAEQAKRADENQAWALREKARAEALEAENGRLREDEPCIREYLAFSHTDGKCNIYADDGELQCANLARHGRTIDFRREPIADLLDIIIGTRQQEYAAALTPPEAQGREEVEHDA